MRVAGRRERGRLGRRQLVGREIATPVEEGKGAVVGHEMLGKKGLGSAETLGKEPPKTPATHLRAVTGEPFDGALGILDRGLQHLDRKSVV